MVLLSALLGVTACANQREVVPLLHVEANAPARIFYFEKRALGMFPELRAQPEAAEAADADGDAPETAAECEEPPPVTWGVAAPAQSSCAPQQND